MFTTTAFHRSTKELGTYHCAKLALLQPRPECLCKPQQSLHERLQNYWCNRKKTGYELRKGVGFYFNVPSKKLTEEKKAERTRNLVQIT